MGSMRNRPALVKCPLASTSNPFRRGSWRIFCMESSPSNRTCLCSGVSMRGGCPADTESLPRSVSGAVDPAADKQPVSASKHRRYRIDFIVSRQEFHVPREKSLDAFPNLFYYVETVAKGNYLGEFEQIVLV